MIASQLRSIRSALQGAPEPIGRPYIRPSVIFDAKEAADIDIGTIFPITLSGLEVLVSLDGRFRSYRDTLFSETSLEIDRESLVPKEEEKLNKSINLFLRLLSGHFQVPAALETLEYLIRRYLVHIYNVDELVLCALPYHQTHVFVRVVQLLNLGNKKWAFLEGVKTSGAPPPRKVIVQQCIRDKGLLETLCNYASPSKEFHQSMAVISFCTAVVLEALGTIPVLDTDTVRRVVDFVSSGLDSDTAGGRDHKAGALMVVGLLATKATLEANLIKKWVSSIARMASADANQSKDLLWLRVIIMALITLMQSQSIQRFSKRTVMDLQKIRVLPQVLSELSHEFNILPFLRKFLESLLEFSTSESSCLNMLCNMIKEPVFKGFAENIASKVLVNNMKSSQANLHKAGNGGEKLIAAINEHHPCELRRAIHKFLENTKLNSKDEATAMEAINQMFDGASDLPLEISESRLWVSLEHPKAAVRKAALLNITTSGSFKAISCRPQMLMNFEDAIVHALHDEDLTVVQAALSIDGLAGVIKPPSLLKAYHAILSRCKDIMNKSNSKTLQACDLSLSCLQHMVMEFQPQHLDYAKDIATIIFPLLLVLPKTWRLNLKALELVKKVKWAFYVDSNVSYDQAYLDKMKSSASDYAASINTKTIEALAEIFLANPQEHLPWLIECSNYSRLSKSLFFFIIMQGLMDRNIDAGSLLKLHQACFLYLKNEWQEMRSSGGLRFAETLNLDELDQHCLGLVRLLVSADIEELNFKIQICIFWSLLRRLSAAASQSTLADKVHGSMLNELFLFFVTSSSKKLFRRHIQYLVTNCSGAPFQFLSKYFVEEGFSIDVQVECLNLFATICSLSASSEWSSLEDSSHLQLLLGFPSLLVPLANRNKDIRTSAIDCVEGLYKIWRCCDISRLRNGNDTILFRCVSSPTFGDFLESIVSQKKLISSDADFLSSYLTSMLSSSGGSLLVPENTCDRFEQAAKDAILLFMLSSALKFSSYGKFMILSLLKGMGTAILKFEGVKLLLFELLEKCKQCTGLDKLGLKLSKNEMETLCLILEVSVPASGSVYIDVDIVNCLLKTLRVDDSSLDDPAVREPCLAILRSLSSAFFNNSKTEIQDEIFASLVFLFRHDAGDVRNATREAFLRINVNSSTVVRFLNLILVKGHGIGSAKRMKKNMTHHTFGLHHDSFDGEELSLSTLFSLLDILLLKKNMDNRISVVRPLFEVLRVLFFDNKLLDQVCQGEKDTGTSSQVPESVTGVVYQAQHLTLLVLKDITDSLLSDPTQIDKIFTNADMNLLVNCARATIDFATRNHVFLLLSSISRVSPKWISDHIIEIFNVVGESALKQNDSHSQQVLEDLIGTLVPCWLSKTRSIDKLLQIFIRALPDIGEHRRLTLILCLLRTLGEESSLGTLFVHLLHSLVQRSMESHSENQENFNVLSSSSLLSKEWEFKLAVQICNQYSCEIWFPCLVKVLEELKTHSGRDEFLLQTHLAMQLILLELQDTQLVFELESGQDAENLQVTLGELLGQVVLQLQLIRERNKIHGASIVKIKELKDCASKVLQVITSYMVPSMFFKSITQLLGHTNGNVKKKTLGLLCETVKNSCIVQKKRKDANKMSRSSIHLPLHIDDTAKPSFCDLCGKIIQLIDNTTADSDTPVKLAAISSIEVLCKQFPSDNMVFVACLTTVVKYILSDDLALSSSCIRATGALIHVLGSKALSQLPLVMKHIMKRCHEVSQCPAGQSGYRQIDISNSILGEQISILVSVLVTLEAIIDELGGFLNPYLGDILDLILLHPEYTSGLDLKIKTKSSAVRKLLTTKIPVRLLLTPVLQIYPRALRCGDVSLSLAFEMLASLIVTMDRQSIETYYVKIFEQCLIALDIRRQQPETVKNVNMVEQSVTHAMIVLTMKLTEAMFRPLFLHSLEWEGSAIEERDSTKTRSVDRAISFYKLVNRLIEQHRSLFVPYFKYLLENCVQYLTENQDTDVIGLKQKRKKPKVGNAPSFGKDKALSPKLWHLRALILKSLYQCFLYDTDQKLLDSSNFQVLLKPIINQLVVEPPPSLEQLLEFPTVEEVDESLVLGLGQMAVTARSDVLWKPLNHEVLMQTRNEKVRPRILGLKVIKYLVEHLKEEYLVLLPETIPFLGELLEDVELPVKTLAQEILKEMETLSGESLRQYL